MFGNYDKMVYLQWFILLEQKRMEKKRELMKENTIE